MEAGTALVGRRILAVFVAVMLMASVMLLFAESPARAGHIPDTGTVPDHCVKFDFGTNPTGTQSPADYPDVDITLDSWQDETNDPHTINFTIAGLEAGQWVEISTKSGTNPVEDSGPYGNGSDSFTSDLQQAISHVTLCVFEEEPLFLRIVKEWDGDDINLEAVDLILLIDETPIEPLAEVEVQDGDIHEIREVVTGLPENCIYTSDPETPFEYTVDAEDAVDGLITLTITNTVECEEATTTSTTVPETTTTTVEDEVLPTVITTSTTVPATTTTVEDEVLDTEVLPFTGGGNDMLALLAGGLGLLGALVLASTRRMEDN